MGHLTADRIGVGPGEVIYLITSREAALTLDDRLAAVEAGFVGGVDRADIAGGRLVRPDGHRTNE